MNNRPVSQFAVSLNAIQHGFVAGYAIQNGMMMDEAVKLLFRKGLALEAERMDEADAMECELEARHG